MSLFKGHISKSAADLSKPFRKRFCTVCWEEINITKSSSLKRLSLSLSLMKGSQKLPNEVPKKKSSAKQLVLTYYKDEKNEETGDYKGKFILDNSDFRDVPEGVKEYRNVVCVKLSPLNNARELYLCFETEEQKNSLLKVLREHIQIKSPTEEDFNGTTESPVKFTPYDEGNPILKELENFRHKIRSAEFSEETQNVQNIPTEKQDLNTSIETHTNLENCIKNENDSTCSKSSSQGCDLSINSDGLLSTHSLKSDSNVCNNSTTSETDSNTGKLI